ncbi:MAG: metalloregulator ArsR/SmtB family transcription factor [Chloroflexota bacterium]|nr:metalloregulator ArsR/SmtB family transcription factor [Chloroflexota bacterium]
MEDQIYSYHAEMCKVFSHPKRLELIDLLRNKEMGVTELSEKLGLASANLSQHLAMMRERHILASRKEGNQVYYRIANPKLLQAFDLLRDILFEQIRQDAALIHGRAN